MANHIEFYNRAVPDKRATLEAGRPIFKDVPYVRIRFPGDNKRVHDAPAHEKTVAGPDGYWLDYTQQYPEHWAIFAKGAGDQIVGTPLSELPMLTEAKRAEFRAVNIHTVEMLAELPDREIQRLGPGTRAYVDGAKAYLSRAAKLSDVAALADENAALRARLEALEAKASPPPDASATFADWEPDDIRAFLKDATGEEPDKRLGKAKLIEMAAAAVAEKRAA